MPAKTENGVLDPQLQFTFGPLEGAEELEESLVSSPPELDGLSQHIDEDIWTLCRFPQDDGLYAHLRTWESFDNPSFHERRAVYLSDAPTQIFDATLLSQEKNSGQVVETRALLSSLIQLGLGRESVLFAYNRDCESFVPQIQDGRMSGYSLDSSQSLGRLLIGQANNMRKLRLTTASTHAYNGISPALMGIYSMARTILNTIEEEVMTLSKPVSTLLQVQSLFQGKQEMIARLCDVMATAPNEISEVDLLSSIFRLVQQAENEKQNTKQTLLDILNAAAKPWVGAVRSWLGFSRELEEMCSSMCPTFVRSAADELVVSSPIESPCTEWLFDPSGLPDFIWESDGRLSFEAGCALRLLKCHLPRHPVLSRQRTANQRSFNLEWDSFWSGIERSNEQARAYQKTSLEDILIFESNEDARGSKFSNELRLRIQPNKTLKLPLTERASLQESIDRIEKPLDGIALDQRNVEEVEDRLSIANEEFGPPLSMIPTLCIRPWIQAQHHLTNRACVWMLFKQFNLRAHFDVLFRFQLLGDGPFTSRICHALFSPELPSSDRKPGYHLFGTAGLQLGSRITWPPASSELRLALMGILTESYFPAGHAVRSSLFREKIPGGLSFAVREMSEEELQRCLDPNSIFALDFLQLRYRASSPLDVVMTQNALSKYDTIFRLLLRVQRVLYSVNRLTHDMGRFRLPHRSRTLYWLQMRQLSIHFAVCISNYFFQGVAKHWLCLHKRLSFIERALDRKEGYLNEGIFALRDLHEELLDRMLLALFLRKRHAEVMRLLEEICEIILRFANNNIHHDIGMDSSKLHEMYDTLRSKINIFVRVCEGLNLEGGAGGRKTNGCTDGRNDNEFGTKDDDNMIGQLLLSLNMSGFFEQ